MFATVIVCLVCVVGADKSGEATIRPQSGKETTRVYRVLSVPEELRRQWRLAPFYQKYLDCQGFPILASSKVSDAAILEAAHIVDQLLAERSDVRRALIANKVRLAVMAPTEQTTDIPEHSDLTPKAYWDRRARGLGPTPIRPAVSCGEENLLGLPGDRYATENILIHEFAHAIHLMGLNHVEKDFDARLHKIYQRAQTAGLWKGTYAATNASEYWAEGVQSYFDTNRLPDHDHNHVRTREQLEKYDHELFRLIDTTFKSPTWRYVAYKQRQRTP